MTMQNYDLIIAGGGTAGCACAYSAAKLGLKTLVIDNNSYLGGAITSQLVIPAMKTNHENLNQDFFNDFVKNMHDENAQITYCDGNPGWFNPFVAQEVLYKMLVESGCHVLLNTDITGISTNITPLNRCAATTASLKTIVSKDTDNIADSKCLSPQILSICFETKYSDNAKNSKTRGFENFSDVSAKYFVDATGDAKLFELSNASLLENNGHSQAMSLRFIMAAVDKKAFADWILELDKDRNVTTVCDIDGDIHFSTAYTWDAGRDWALAPIFDKAVKEKVLKNEHRAYFQLFTVAGMPGGVAFNCPRIQSETPLNPNSQQDLDYAIKQGRETISRLADFCRKYLVGFENAYIYKIADKLGIRESKRINGKYVLTANDIINGREFAHPVAISDYPIDVHSINKDDSTLHYVQKPYQVPLESLMSNDYNNLFAIGRCISAEFLAQAAIRIQPTCFSMGEGLAKYFFYVLKQ